MRAIDLLSFHYQYRISDKDSVRNDIHYLIRVSIELFLKHFPDSRQALKIISKAKYPLYRPDSTQDEILNYTKELIPLVENKEIRTKLKYRIYKNPPSSLLMLKFRESSTNK